MRACRPLVLVLLAGIASAALLVLLRGDGTVATGGAPPSTLVFAAGGGASDGGGGDATARAVIGVLSTASRADVVAAGWLLWGNASVFPVVVVTDGGGAVGPRGVPRSRVWTLACAPDHGRGLCCKTSAFVQRAQQQFPSARWFLRVTDDTFVDTGALAELLAGLGRWDTPRTVGHRLTAALTFDAIPGLPPTESGMVEYITGGAMLISRGAAEDARLPGAFRAACAEWPADDVAWAAAGAALGWPRPEPSAAIWNYAPSLDVEGGRGGCQPWYFCAARAAGLAPEPTSWAPPEAPRGGAATRLHVTVTARPVTFHLHGGLIEKGPWVLAALAVDGPLVVEVGAAPARRSHGGAEALDDYYAREFATERVACAAAEARARRELGRPVKFPCSHIGAAARDVHGVCGRREVSSWCAGSFGCHCERAAPCSRFNASGQHACLLPTRALGRPIYTLPPE